MKTINKYKKLMMFLLLPLGILLFILSSYFPALVENIYSNLIYRFIAQIISLITGIFPISAAEFLVAAFLLYAFWKIIDMLVKTFKDPNGRKLLWKKFIANTLAYTGVLYFTFLTVWGFNYHRLPFSKVAGFDTKPASTKELGDLCEDLLIRTNSLRTMVKENAKGVMKLPEGKTEAAKKAYKGFEEASKIYPVFKGSYGRPKEVIFSQAMSWTGIGGIYFPFTAEANVNADLPDSSFPATLCHEMAHQRGFPREDEANYIAYLACKNHPDVEFQYSGTLLALNYSMGSLSQYDRKRFDAIRKRYSPGLLRDLTAANNFWKQYQGRLQKVASKVNNAYLKANMQKDGVHSYGRMVDLLLAEYKTRNK
ncbi:MAG: DUF3810 domain-containing protein [Clostridia bacterium]|nr:DUF3810 domain-containing protein [Clostridia bacterium]